MRTLLAILFALAVIESTAAQTTVGIQSLGTYDSAFDKINVADLGIHLDIPLVEHSARGNGMGNFVHLMYDSGTNQFGQDGWLLTDVGWRVAVGTAGAGHISIYQKQGTTSSDPGTGGTCTIYIYQFAYVDSSGFTHGFPGTTRDGCQNGTPVNTSLQATAADGTGYSLSATGESATVTAPSGQKYTLSYGAVTTSVSDTNENQGGVLSTPSYSQSWSATLTDTSNARVAINGGAYSNELDPTTWTRAPLTVQYYDTTGTPQTITLTYKIYNLTWSCPSGSTGSQNVGMVDSVSYPDGSAYRFTYQASGALESVQLPTGGTITYQGNQGVDALECPLPPPSSISRETSDGTTTYGRSVDAGNSGAPTASTTTVSRADGSSEKVHFVYYDTANIYFSNSYNYETAHFWYSPSSTLLQSTMRCYNGSTGTCTTTAVVPPITQIATTTTIGSLSSNHVELLNAAGLPTETDDYNFGSSTAARKTVTSYASLANNIQNRPSSITVYDGTGNIAAQTRYSYDDFTLASSGVSGLAAISGARGNQTTVQRLVSSSASVSSYNHYDNAGQVVSSTDANSHVTSYGHDSTDTYVTSKTYPAVSAGTFSETYTPDSNTGLLLQSKDMNGKITGYTYDSMLRQTGVCLPDGGYTQTTYPSSTTKTAAVLEGTGTGCTPGAGVPSGTWATSTMQYDGYGRLIHATDPAGNTTDISYDSMGREYSVSNPHGSASASTDGTTYYLYDSFGRKTKQTSQDGSIGYWCYNGIATASAKQPHCNAHIGSATGTWVDYQDENGNQWQRTTDALGRLSSVIEPNGTALSPSMETDYTYDVLNNLLSVTQCGGACPGTNSVIRNFSYDSLSRLLQAFNPESGWTCYGTTAGAAPNGSNCTSGYDANGNLQYKTDARGIVTSSSYDALNRLIAKTYSDSTPAVQFNYDESATTVGSGSNIWKGPHTTLNGTGRLTSQYVGMSAPGVGLAVKDFSYDEMGRVTNSSECWGATECASPYGTRALIWVYDLAGNLITMNNSASRTFSYTYDAAGRLQTAKHIANALSPNVTTSMINSVTYFPSGQPQTITTDTGTATVTGTWAADKRLRMTSYVNQSTANAGNTNYGYTLSYTPNSNVSTASETVYVPGTGQYPWTWTYTYDTLNRLSSGITSAGAIHSGCQETYDPWGNRIAQTSKAGLLCTQPATPVIPGTNRLSGATYDAAGNMLSNTVGTIQAAFTYDAEGRIASSTPAGGQTTTYLYGADGQRVGKTLGGVATNYSRDLDGSLLVTYNAGGYGNQELWAGGKHFGTVWISTSGSAGAQTQNFSLTNWLGSETTRTDPSTGIPTSAYESQPFGDSQTTLFGSDLDTIHFTGKEHDTESNNDYFGARYYGSALGRWMSPDLPFADQDTANPQSWNLYGYVRNNPLNSVDDSGLLTIIIGGTGYNPGSWNYSHSPLTAEAQQHFNDPAVGFLYWSGGLSDTDRMAGAEQLRKMINSYDFAPGEQLNIIAHSHGGNVALLAAQMKLKHPISNLITLGTPGLQSYAPNVGDPGTWRNIGKWYNIQASTDWVPSLDSDTNSRNRGGAQNFTVPTPGLGHFGEAHTALWQNNNIRNLWWSWFLNQQQTPPPPPNSITIIVNSDGSEICSGCSSNTTNAGYPGWNTQHPN